MTKKIAIVGGGYVAISCAIELIEKGYKVYLIESRGFLGGLGECIKLKNGSICEKYYHHYFSHDNYLIEYCRKFLNKSPLFTTTSMSIFFKDKFYPWNSLIDIISTKLISPLSKLRFLISTLLLSTNIIPNKILDEIPLSKGMRRFYGFEAYKKIWDPITSAKFGNLVNEIPLTWMKGRLKQRVKSRKNGKEKLGFIKGSLLELTDSIHNYFKNNELYEEYLNSELISLKKKSINSKNQLELKIKKSTNSPKYINFNVDQVAFTINTFTANKIIKNFSDANISWPSHRYFAAICVLIELKSPLADFYWNNISDKNNFFCGYIEQSHLTGDTEYGGINVGYLTKYLAPNDINLKKSEKEIEDISLKSLIKLFGKEKVKKNLIKIHISKDSNAQVVTDFKFTSPNMNKFSKEGLFLGNMANVFPDERSINNAIAVGKKLANKIIASK